MRDKTEILKMFANKYEIADKGTRGDELFKHYEHFALWYGTEPYLRKEFYVLFEKHYKKGYKILDSSTRVIYFCDKKERF